MEPDELQLAISYADLAQSLAFKDFISAELMECERLELEALTIPATDFESARSAIIAWQQRRIVVRSLQEKVQHAAQNLRQEEMELNDARPDRTNW